MLYYVNINVYKYIMYIILSVFSLSLFCVPLLLPLYPADLQQKGSSLSWVLLEVSSGLWAKMTLHCPKDSRKIP